MQNALHHLPRIFLLTHPVWDVTNYLVQDCIRILISTHTSRVGCDYFASDDATASPFLLTHPVWDVTSTGGLEPLQGTIFLLTHPVWDVTISNR